MPRSMYFLHSDEEKIKDDLGPVCKMPKGFIRTVLAKRIRMRAVPACSLFLEMNHY